MSTQNFDKNNDVMPNNSHKETLKAQDLDIEGEFLILLTGKGFSESEKSYNNSYDLKGEKDSFCKKQERLNAAFKAPNDRSIEEAVLLSTKEPTSRTTSDQTPKEATKICGEDQDSFLNLNITYSHDQQQLESLKASSSGLKNHLFALESKINSFDSLQDLDFTRCLLGKQAIKALCSNSNLCSLKSLILTENPTRNGGVKFISETSKWPKLQMLTLCNTKIDYDGIKWLAMNESWICLKELDLSENPLIGDLGAISLCLNRTWTSLKTLGLWGCNIGKVGDAALRRHRNHTVLFGKDKTIIENQNQNFRSKKSGGKCIDHKNAFLTDSFLDTRDSKDLQKNLLAYPFASSNLCLQNSKALNRGGAPQDQDSNDSSGIDYSVLLAKLQHYKQKILTDTSLEKELNLFIAVHASTIPGNQDHGRTNNEGKNREGQPLEMSVDILRHLLDYESSEASKILLLTGQAGSGKSFFCKYLHRELLSNWSQNPDPEGINWFPIYVELSSLKNPKSEALSETLIRELSLTDNEIRFLKDSKQSNLVPLLLLFMFDGYDAIEDIYAFDSLSSRQDVIDNNFFVLNKIDGESWKNVKFIITCREENLQKVQRRDLLFGPGNTQSTEFSVASEAFLQRKIDPFSDEQITCYLKKYCYYELKATAEEGSSWSQVEKFEQMINNYHLRDIARTPFMLWIMCRTLPKLVTEKPGQIDEIKFILPQRLSRRFLIDLFVNEVISSITKESLGASNISKNKEEHKDTHQEEVHPQADLYMKIRKQAQNFALKSRGYSINKAVNEHNQNDDPSTLRLDPLLSWDNNHSRVKFGYPLLLEFFVANSIEEEIGKIDPSTQPNQLKMKKTLLINQRLLTSEASGVIIILFLSDAFKEKRLTSNQFINLIYLSREKELVNQENNDEEITNTSHSSSHTPFTIAASNAITILNAAGYNFGSQDLSKINIPSVNLSFGKFECTNFTDTDLQGVDFTGARLKSANFEKANLESIEFGAVRELKLRNEKIKKISYSPDGKYFAVDVGAETVIFEVVDMQRSHFKEIKRFPGYFLGWRKLNRTQAVTIQGERIVIEKGPLEKENENIYHFMGKYEDNYGYSDGESNVCFCIWDVISGQSVQNLNVRTSDKRILSFNSERKEVITINDRQVQIYEVASDSWIKLPFIICNSVTNFDLLAKNSSMPLVGAYQTITVLRNLTIGKSILNKRQKVTSCNISLNGKQRAVGTSRGVIYISDFVRGCIIKSFINRSKNGKPKAIDDCSFDMDGKQILSITGNKLTLQDIADPKLGNSSLASKTSDGYVYCLRPDAQQIAIVDESHTIYFHNLSMVADLSTQNSAIRGKNLNLQGVIANSSVKLSEENIALLHKRGDYRIFCESMIKKLFPSSSTESEDVREVVLVDKKLTSIHARIIGSDLHWINLQRLDLSRNNIGEEGGQAIGNNKAWTNLEGLILMYAEIGDETAKAIANNTNLQKLKKLHLGFNKIRTNGAEAIVKNNIWVGLESLNLSSNLISDKHTLITLCSNKTWEYLKFLLLGGNPVMLDKVDVHQIVGDIFSKSLKALALPLARFDLLLDLKYSAPKSVTDLSLQENTYNDTHAEIIGSNTTWKTLKKLRLSNNRISDYGGKKLGSNTAWIDLEELDLSSNSLETQSAAVIGENTTWGKLRVLNLNSNKIGTEGSYAIANNRTWLDLQTLELQGNSIGAKGVAAICQNKIWTKLQTLNLEKNLIDLEGAEELSKNESWNNLQSLNLSSNALGAEGAFKLSKNESWTNLQSLNLSSNSIGDEGAAELARNTSWKSLQTLNLYNNKISDKGAGELSRNTSWINLQALDLGNNSIGAEGAAEMIRNTSWMNLQTLNLECNKIGAEGAAKLSKNESLTNLQSLNLSSNSIGDEGAAELAKYKSWINLQTLNLEHNSIGDKGAGELSRNTSWVNLQTLDLGNNSIGEEGAAELSQNTSWKNLKSLNLSYNWLGPEGVARLNTNTSWNNLQILNLSSNNLGTEGAARLSENTTWKNLQTLELKRNSIGAEGAFKLSKNESWTNLQSLNLCDNSVCTEGVVELSNNRSWKNLQSLDLQHNSIGFQGAAYLSQNASWKNLQSLNLSYNWIGNTGATYLSQNTSWTNLQSLHLEHNTISLLGAQDLEKNTTWPETKKINY